MKLPNYWLKILATINLIFYLIILISSLFDIGIFLVFIPRYYYYIIILSSLLIYLNRDEIATALQIVGCFFHGFLFFLTMGIGMAFTNQNFWESLANSPFVALDFFSFIGFSIIAVILSIFEYHKYKAEKQKKVSS